MARGAPSLSLWHHRDSGWIEGDIHRHARREGISDVGQDDEDVVGDAVDGEFVFHVAAEVGGFGDAGGEAGGAVEADGVGADGVGADGEFGGAVLGAAVGEGEGDVWRW